MQRKLISRLLMIFSCIFLCLCTACAKQGNTAAFLGKIESLHAAIPSTAQIREIPDFTSIFNTQNTDNTQDTFLIEYTTHTTLTSPVAIIMYSEKRSTEAVHGETIYTSICTYPVVIIESNENTANKINADIQAIVNDFYANTSYPESAKEDYERYYNTNLHSYYSNKMLFTVTRADSNVISFLITSQWYAGGAHDMYSYTGLNYDTQTGELIPFADLSENADAFHQDTLAFHQHLAATNAYKSIMWSDEDTWKENQDLEDALYQDNKWYLSTSGLVFFSNPYELGAFFAGKIEFTIPYADLKEMGFQEKYSYHGPKIIWLQTEEICSLDLNGDGQEEEIQFYIDQPGSYETDFHFTINGTDYAAEHEQLSDQLSEWTKCFLYDMNTEDDTIEIAFQNSWEEDTIIFRTFLYRYEKDDSLTYLGEIENTVTDPTAVFDFMPEYDTLTESKIIYTG